MFNTVGMNSNVKFGACKIMTRNFNTGHVDTAKANIEKRKDCEILVQTPNYFIFSKKSEQQPEKEIKHMEREELLNKLKAIDEEADIAESLTPQINMSYEKDSFNEIPRCKIQLGGEDAEFVKNEHPNFLQ